VGSSHRPPRRNQNYTIYAAAAMGGAATEPAQSLSAFCHACGKKNIFCTASQFKLNTQVHRAREVHMPVMLGNRYSLIWVPLHCFSMGQLKIFRPE
jgi:hypothetical protein